MIGAWLLWSETMELVVRRSRPLVRAFDDGLGSSPTRIESSWEDLEHRTDATLTEPSIERLRISKRQFKQIKY